MTNNKYAFQGIFVALLLSFSSMSIAQEVTNKVDSISYTLGVLFAKNIKQQGVTDVNPDIVTKAINDYMSGNTTVIPEDKCEAMFRGYLEKVKEEKSKAAKADGVKYLAENAKRQEISVTESGLQYEVLTKGDGEIPTASDKVKTHYHGMLIDGTVFDSSVDRGEPISFPVSGVIKGWQEALQLMPVGSKWRIYVPSELAYGARGAGPSIPPHSVLVFEVELLDIQ